jgi:hypothetical protein
MLENVFDSEAVFSTSLRRRSSRKNMHERMTRRKNPHRSDLVGHPQQFSRQSGWCCEGIAQLKPTCYFSQFDREQTPGKIAGFAHVPYNPSPWDPRGNPWDTRARRFLLLKSYILSIYSLEFTVQTVALAVSAAFVLPNTELRLR